MIRDSVPSNAGVARWLRLLVIAFSLCSAIWLWGLFRQGAWWAAILSGAVLMLLPGGFVAVQCLLAAGMRGRDGTPRASATAWLRAFIAEVGWCMWLFGWVQPFCTHRWPDRLPEPACAGDKALPASRGVVLVHGYTCGRGMWLPWLSALKKADISYISVDLVPIFGSIEHYAPLIDAAIHRMQAATGLAPLVVAHSMGGLAVRAWWRWARLHHDSSPEATSARVHAVMTIGSPHQGTWLARMGVTTNARQMRIGGSWLRELAAQEPEAWRQRFVCAYSNCDNVVFPPRVAVLEGSRALYVQGRAHLELAFDPLVRSTAMQLLGDASGQAQLSSSRRW